MSELAIPSPPQKKGWNPFLIVGLGCGGFAVAGIVLFLIVVVAAFLLGGASVEPEVDEFFERYNRDAFSEIAEDAHSKFIEATPAEQLERMLGGLKGALGRYQSKSLRGMDVNINTATARFATHFENGEATVSFTFYDSEGDWKLVAFNFNSPLIDEALVCKKCGAKSKEFAEFCPSCGEKVE